ncbi:MAG: large conductance mechanosensitive channel protein MscL [Anaerolineales bacterium]|nr:large conductance mechanosensitive channel protein MscL [Anaerolineales bacterium]MCW5854645.1 large conductance mechanosensitive channel protein MscL [Anaerolineales bacterium]
MLQEFRDFAMRGNAIDLAIGLVIGSSFTSIVDTLVNGILMPPIGLLLGGADFKDLFLVLKPGEVAGPYVNLEAAQQAGAVTVNYGELVTVIIHFVIVAFAMFLVVKAFNRLHKGSTVSGKAG